MNVNLKLSLSPKQKAVYHVLAQHVDQDVNIEQLHGVAYPHTPQPFVLSGQRVGPRERRAMQQRLGSCIQRINARLDGQKVVPGRLKGTYRLSTTGA